MRRITAFSVLAALALALGPPPAAAQKIGDRELFEKSLQVAQKALEQYGGNEEGEELERVADLGYRVAQQAGFDRFPLTFHLIDMPEPNAFALPGGHIFVTRGMLDLGLDDDMLAALLGHEIAHVALDHHGRMQRRATLMQVLSQALLVGVMVGASNSEDRRPATGPYRSPEPYGSGRGEMIQGAAATSLIVNELLLRSFSREHEDEADEGGQRWAAAAGFDPDGTGRLMSHMGERLPQSKKYGYWRTHPFFDDRVRAAEARGELLKSLGGKPDDPFRRATQAALVAELESVEPELRPLLEQEALTAWPGGEAADRIRRDRLHRHRDATLAKPSIERDYGKLIGDYRRQIGRIESNGISAGDAGSNPVLAQLDEELAKLEAERTGLYPKAREILAEGVYETAFLDRFLSNWPDAPEATRVALLLGDARSRLGQETEAVAHYLTAWRTGPDSEEGRRAALGLRNLAPHLDQLAALQQLAEQDRDPELASLADSRLTEIAGEFREIENGAEYLRRFPDAPRVVAVRERIDSLAEKLYAEVVLYQALGDHVKAVERINKILTHAPLSHAAEQLRDRAVLDT